MKPFKESINEIADLYISVVKGAAILGIVAMVMLNFHTIFDTEKVSNSIFELQLYIGIGITLALVSAGLLAALTEEKQE